MKNVLWTVTHCGSEEHIASIIRAVFLRSVFQLLVNANVPSSQILSALLMKAIPSSETSVLTGSTRQHISEDGILPGNIFVYRQFTVCNCYLASQLRGQHTSWKYLYLKTIYRLQ
jgi:hypothetical protein